MSPFRKLVTSELTSSKMGHFGKKVTSELTSSKLSHFENWSLRSLRSLENRLLLNRPVPKWLTSEKGHYDIDQLENESLRKKTNWRNSFRTDWSDPFSQWPMFELVNPEVTFLRNDPFSKWLIFDLVIFEVSIFLKRLIFEHINFEVNFYQSDLFSK